MIKRVIDIAKAPSTSIKNAKDDIPFEYRYDLSLIWNQRTPMRRNVYPSLQAWIIHRCNVKSVPVYFSVCILLLLLAPVGTTIFMINEHTHSASVRNACTHTYTFADILYYTTAPWKLYRQGSRACRMRFVPKSAIRHEIRDTMSRLYLLDPEFDQSRNLCLRFFHGTTGM